MDKTVTMEALPKTAEDIKRAVDFKSPFCVAAYAAAAFVEYENDADACIEMVNALRGPEPLSVLDKQFIRDRLGGKGYVPRSFFSGTSPENDYKLSAPYSVNVSDNAYSYANEGYVTLYMKSSGADSPRSVQLRKKGSTGEWFIRDQNFLGDIRVPKSMDAWA